MLKNNCDYFSKKHLQVYYLDEPGSVEALAQDLKNGKIVALDMTDVYCFLYNPAIDKLYEKLVILKGREQNQFFNLMASYEQIKNNLLDEKLVNQDFLLLNEKLCSKFISRVPIKGASLNHIGNPHDKTIQFMSLDGLNPLLAQLQKKLEEIGVPYLAGTSCNLHSMPSIKDANEAEKLSVALNWIAEAIGMEVELVIAHLDKIQKKKAGSFPIVSFVNTQIVEVLRLTGKLCREKTEELTQELKNQGFKTPVIYKV